MALHIATKVVVKRPKGGSIKRYKYYQLVRSYHRKGEVRTKYVCYLGKEPCLSQQKAREIGLTPEELEGVEGLNVLANREPAPVDVLANQDPNRESLPLDVLANRNLPPPLDLEVIEPEEKERGYWSFPRYRATCRRCGERFEMIKFEVELGHYLCQRCRAEIIKNGERSSRPGY